MSEISFEAVSKTFGASKQIGLRPTSLLIEQGRFVTILGASGSGKTTLLKLINRLHRPDTGLIRVAGRDISQIRETALRREIGYVIQHVGLFRHMSVARNIAIVPEILKWPQSKIDSRVDELLNMVGLEPKRYRNRYPRQLSGGQQQRVGLARALAGDPAILLMDEPFGALDAIIREKLQDELIDIQGRLRKTIVFVTHDVQEALKLGDKVIVMNEGQVQQYDTPATILADPANAFIAQLLGADDPYRHFSFMPAKVLMSRFNPEMNSPEITDSTVPVIGENQNLNDALKSLLKAPGNFVLVADNHQRVVGKITLEDLKAASREALSNDLGGRLG